MNWHASLVHPGVDHHRFADLPSLWLGQRGWLAEGGNEKELMLVAGWKSRITVDRYSRATAAERAQASLHACRRPIGYRGSEKAKHLLSSHGRDRLWKQAY